MMPNDTSKRVPKYRKHKRSGNALVVINGREIYLGKHGFAASIEKYNRLIVEWLQSERQSEQAAPFGSNGSTPEVRLGIRHGRPRRRCTELPRWLRWEFPLWLPADIDPAALAGKKTKQEERQTQNDRDGMRDIITELLIGPAPASKLRKATGLGPNRADCLTAMLIQDNQITSIDATTHGNKSVEYSIVDDTE